ncbi:MAG: hypothetical protein IKU54_04245 [Oscillospiraceae bacterium]|nr:hypothetical protein [Oscillospiraceae bacterium]
MNSSEYSPIMEYMVYLLPFLVFTFLNNFVNVKKQNRNRQYIMPLVAILYSLVVFVFMGQLSELLMQYSTEIATQVETLGATYIDGYIPEYDQAQMIYFEFILFNTAAIVAYVIIKRVITSVFGRITIEKDSFIGSAVELFYQYNDQDGNWYLKEHYGQTRTFIKTAYYTCCSISLALLPLSGSLYMNGRIDTPFYPVFPIIIIGELAFYIDGIILEDGKSGFTLQADKSRRVAMYPLLRKPLKKLFGDKLSAEGTTINNGVASGGAVEDILVGIERNGGHLGRNYAAFIRHKMGSGLKPNVDYVRCGYDLATGKSLLFNTPFYDKLNPYVFYAINRELLTGGKILVVLGRHGTENDLHKWISDGMRSVSNIPDLWKIATIKAEKMNEDDMPDIGIISPSAVHDLDIHKNNLMFLKKVSFVVVVEPSKLITTAQIGLNLLVKCCGKERPVTFCSVDRNCDGLVDALSHILMTNITEVSATEYPHGMSSYMYWTADNDYLQHRILPGVSRNLGMGTEISMVALKNQVKKTVWYGGDVFPVLDAHWIAKQYYYDLLNYAQLNTTQETFDNCFKASFSMSDERVSDYSFITVEDDRNNLFETRRNFATIAEVQGFVNVISSEYMLREYMSANTEWFTADAKAIPYITADYARTKRNAILSLCLLMSINAVQEETLIRHLSILNIDTKDAISEIWKEVCAIFSQEDITDKYGTPILSVKNSDGEKVYFEKDNTIQFKREYSIETGRFESVYVIKDEDFSRIILDDLHNASYIAEHENEDIYIGTELKGHVYQKYLTGQFLTLNGKYYEMVSASSDNRILVRRASEHIGGRLAYRQIRNYKIHSLENSTEMGALKSVNNIDIHRQFADFNVDTPGYWKLQARNDFDNGALIKVNGVPTREYRHKQILKLDFSRFGDAFTDSVRMTLTNLLNETFVTLFAENQAFISAVTPGAFDAPLTYSLEMAEDIENADKCIFIIEDSQLDIGLLIAVERNVNRILQIITDYLAWNEERITESIRKQNEPETENKVVTLNSYSDEYEGEGKKKKGFFQRLWEKIKSFFKKKDKKAAPVRATEPEEQKNYPVAEETAPENDTAANSVVSEEQMDEMLPAEETAQEFTEGPVEEPAENPTEESALVAEEIADETDVNETQQEEKSEEKEVIEGEQ